MSTISPNLKKYLFRVLKKFYQNIKNKTIGIDLASENFKNSIYFQTKKYIGVDIEIEQILFGLKNFRKQRVLWDTFIDFTKKNILGENFADVVVSTNTFTYKIKKKINALDNCIKFISKNGVFFLEVEIQKKYYGHNYKKNKFKF